MSRLFSHSDTCHILLHVAVIRHRVYTILLTLQSGVGQKALGVKGSEL